MTDLKKKLPEGSRRIVYFRNQRSRSNKINCVTRIKCPGHCACFSKSK